MAKLWRSRDRLRMAEDLFRGSRWNFRAPAAWHQSETDNFQRGGLRQKGGERKPEAVKDFALEIVSGIAPRRANSHEHQSRRPVVH